MLSQTLKPWRGKSFQWNIQIFWLWTCFRPPQNIPKEGKSSSHIGQMVRPTHGPQEHYHWPLLQHLYIFLDLPKCSYPIRRPWPGSRWQALSEAVPADLLGRLLGFLYHNCHPLPHTSPAQGNLFTVHPGESWVKHKVLNCLKGKRFFFSFWLSQGARKKENCLY